MKKVKRSEDRISGLPDAVLSHILSYLTTKQSVRTSILSKRWLFVWSLVPDLRMDDSCLSFDDPDKELAILSSFSQCLDNVFNLRKADTLPKLTLAGSMFDGSRVNEWVTSAMSCKVKEFALCTYENEDFRVGAPLFACQYLVALKLGNYFVLDIPEEVRLPSLKKLHLDYIRFSDDESCHRLLSGCPVLEYLNMESCDMGEGKTFQIISSTLKFLSLRCGYECQVVVDAPYLEVFTYKGCMAERSSFKNLGSLNEAYIDVRVSNRTNDMIEIFLQLINSIANAKIITFTGPTLEVFSSLDRTTFPMFNGLTKLVLVGQRYYVMLLPKFLERAPFLQDLVLESGPSYDRSFEFEWHDPIQVPRCLLDSLKSLQVSVFNEESSNVLKVIKYLVANARVLVKISTCKKNEELKVSKQLINLLLGK